MIFEDIKNKGSCVVTDVGLCITSDVFIYGVSVSTPEREGWGGGREGERERERQGEREREREREIERENCRTNNSIVSIH